jgi:hypothetical protein
VLSDDPGCSVLTVSSIGMTLRTFDKGRKDDKSRFVALWKDPVSGAREIALDPGASAILLTLTSRPAVEWTADFRKSRVHNPQLSSVIQIEDMDTHEAEVHFAKQEMTHDVMFIGPSEASALARLAQLTQLTQHDDGRKEVASRLIEILSGMDAASRRIAKEIVYRQFPDNYKRPADVPRPIAELIENDSIEDQAPRIAASIIIEWAKALRRGHSSTSEENSLG